MNDLEDRIAQEKSRILYQQSRSVAVNSFLMSLFAAALFSNGSVHLPLIGWVVANAGLLAGRLQVIRAYQRESAQAIQLRYRHWTRLLVLGTFVNGCLWGVLHWIVLSDDIFRNSVLMVMQAGYIAVASTTTSAVVAAFLAFAIPSTLLMILAMAGTGGIDHWPYLALQLIAAVMFYGFARRANAALGEQIRLQLENAELLQHVRTERDRAETATQAKSHFLAAASHDLRQPVHALGLFAGSLEPHVSTADGRNILQRMRQSIESLSGLFDGLLDISRLDAGVVENRPRHILLDTLCLKLYSEFLPVANRKGLTFSTECTQRPTAVFADPLLLERILRNLVSNAINYTDTGGVEVRVDNSGQSVLIAVRDTGHGIAEKDIPVIFSEYRQLENPEGDGQKGLGLGLSIVKRLGDLMEITIGVDSRPGRGSTFTLSLPHGDADQVRRREQGHHMLSHDNLTVLIIDDEQDIRDGMRTIFSSWGINTLTASSIDTALAALQGAPAIGLIIADYRLGGQDNGLDAIERIREELNIDIPALLITGDTGPERLREVMDSGIHWLHKPVSPNALIDQINTVLKPRDSDHDTALPTSLRSRSA